MSKISNQTGSKKGAASKASKSSLGTKSGKTPGKPTAESTRLDGSKKKTEWSLPPFSILPKKPKDTLNWEKLKRFTLRRQAPEGEDIEQIKRVLKEIGDRKIPVHDFINLISSYTSDNGALLRKVLEEDTDAFRKLARKVYETMTQDVSDVLVNEQVQLMNFYQEKQNLLTEKMMRAINEIYDMAPKFDFERFMKNREEYLNMILPIPAQLIKNEDIDMQRRQAAYHRLQWLRSEGERMREENKRLQDRLEELKIEQQIEQERNQQLVADAEAKRQQLSQQESDMKNKLQELNDSVEKTMIENEATITKVDNKKASKRITKDDEPKKRDYTKRKRQPDWISAAASEIEETVIKEIMAVEAEGLTPSRVPKPKEKYLDPACTCYLTDADMPQPKIKLPQIVSPPQPQPPAPVQHETKVESATTHIQRRRPPSIIKGRRNMAPPDTWQGFN